MPEVSNVSGSCSATMSATISTTGTVQGPANDNFANAQGLTGSSATVTGTNNGATKETGEPNHVGNIGGKSVWYKWTQLRYAARRLHRRRGEFLERGRQQRRRE